jgi:hypothetical protein
MSRILIIIGLILIVIGFAWPWIVKIGFGHLPGDIIIKRENFRFYFPITTSIVISVILSLLFWLLRK